jgi:GNAT superfamily N-acetyltransferase
MTELEKIYEELDDGTEGFDSEMLELAGQIRQELEVALKAGAPDDEDLDEYFAQLVRDDDALLEEFIDKLAFLNACESIENVGNPDLEKAYLNVVDTLLELSKTINPLGGFNKERLKSALDMINDFEERYWPVSTRITAENATAFETMIPEQHYDDILTSRKNAIGALRQVGDSTCAAGVIVYSVCDNEEADGPVIRIDWIYVHQSFRQKGVGNFLVARILELALQCEAVAVTIDLFTPDYGDEYEMEEREIFENFLDSWKFGFDLSTGKMFVIKAGDIDAEKFAGLGTEGVSSLRTLGENGPDKLKEFFDSLGDDVDPAVASASYELFDVDASCIICEDNAIQAALLLHRMPGGNFRFETINARDALDIQAKMKLLGYAYETAVSCKDEDKMVYGRIRSEEGLRLAGDVIPNARVPMMMTGYLSLPQHEISNEEWDAMRRVLGLSDDKFPEDEE